jgi:DNA-binding protein HU-beta
MITGPGPSTEGENHVNKAELVEALAQHYDGSKAEASRALNAVVQTITRTTAAGDKVAITGFGVFEKVERPARIVRNPRTGERKEAPATAVPRFRPGTELKAYVAGQRDLPEVVENAAPVAAPARARTRRPRATADAAAVQEPLVAPADVVTEPEPSKAPRKSSVATAEKAAPKKKAEAKKPAAKQVDVKKAVLKKVDAKKASARKADAKKADAKKADAKKKASKKDVKKSGKK